MVTPNVPDFSVIVKEESPEAQTGGHFATPTIGFDVNAGQEASVNICAKIPISVLSVKLLSKNVEDGDRMRLEINPGIRFGADGSGNIVTANATTWFDSVNAIGNDGDIVTIPDGLCGLFDAEKLFKGIYINVGGQDLGFVTNYDSTNKQLTTSKKAVGAIAADSPILFTVCMTMSPFLDLATGLDLEGWIELQDIHPWAHDFGESKIGGSYMEAGYVLRLRYENNGAAQKRIVARFELLY